MKSLLEFARFKQERQPITMVTCYDAWSAKLIADTPIDVVLVGDSAAMVMHGHDSTVHARLEMMAAHTAAAARGLAGRTFIVADLPFPLHRMGAHRALEAADTLLKAGAQAVKLEGVRGHEEVVRHLVESGVPVMGHLGLTPQSVHQLGGYRVQARDDETAQALLLDARLLEAAGAFALVLECIPSGLAAEVTEALAIPTIGIGSGVQCDGQVLVLQDLLGLNEGFRPKFLRTYLDGAGLVKDALRRYTEDVKSQAFPAREESFS
ncbi:MAG: 3-methyl-2-oxobutanoate hydroxymethyltransferase [Opitutales bacterium]